MNTILPEPDLILDPPELPEIPLPKCWTDYTLLAILHVIALARLVILNAANWPEDKKCDGLRLRVENDRLRSDVGLLKREIKIKDARFARLEPKRRPHYLPCERLEILMIRGMSWLLLIIIHGVSWDSIFLNKIQPQTKLLRRHNEYVTIMA